MDLHAIASGYSLRRALALEHADLPRSAVLCGKLLALLWLATGQVVYLRADPVGFGGVQVDVARGPVWVQAMILGQLVSILTIVCSRFFRAGCALLAGMIALLSALDQPLFSNNRAFCALLLAMLALGGGARFARLQLALVYGCAALDKLLAQDWRSGVFLRTFSAELCRVGELWSPGRSPGGALAITCALSGVLDRVAWLASFAGVLVITTELAIAVGYARGARATVLIAVGFHAAVFIATGSTFGMFFYAGVAAALIVVELEHLPTPWTHAVPHFVVAALFAGPWVRPWHAAALPLLVSGLAWHGRRAQRNEVAQQRS